MKDEDFDNLIRKSIEGQNIKFEPDHWKKMAQKLELAAATESYNRIIRTSVIVLTFLWSLVMLWLYLNNSMRANNLASHQANYEESIVSSTPEKQEMTDRAAGYPSGQPVPPKALPSTPQTGKTELKPGKATSGDRAKAGPVSGTRQPEGLSGTRHQGSSNRPGTGNGDGHFESPAHAVSNKAGPESHRGTDLHPAGELAMISYLERMPADIAHSPYAFTPNLRFPGTAPHTIKKVDENDKKSRVSGLYVSLNAAANLSSVGFSQMGPPGFDGGVTFEYFLGEKVSVVTGVMHSTKKYTIDKGYNPGSYHSYYNETITKVDGNCAVLDIPLNLRYYFISSKKHLFFLSSGMSSYLMLNEAYDIYYSGNYGRETKRTKEVSNENKHIFGIVNFSFGYERVLSGRFSLQVAPFVKLPVTDIGDGRVGLTSAGAFFSIKYRMR